MYAIHSFADWNLTKEGFLFWNRIAAAERAALKGQRKKQLVSNILVQLIKAPYFQHANAYNHNWEQVYEGLIRIEEIVMRKLNLGDDAGNVNHFNPADLDDF